MSSCRATNANVITADTVTDEQIRELRTWVDAMSMTIGIALLGPKSRCVSDTLKAEVARARARCADLLNARAKAQP